MASKMDIAEAPDDEAQSKLDLAATALLRLPLPVLLLSADGTIVLANKAAEDHFRPWHDTVLNTNATILVRTHIGQIGGCREFDHGAPTLDWGQVLLSAAGHVSNRQLYREDFREYLFLTRVELGETPEETLKLSISCLTVEGKEYFSLLFQDSPSPDTSPSSTSSEVEKVILKSDKEVELENTIKQLRSAVYDSAQTIAYTVSADGKIVIFNRAAKAFLGPKTVENVGYDGTAFLTEFTAWNIDFTQELPISQRPGRLLLSKQKNIPERTHGFMITATGMKYVMRISGECLWDPETSAFIGGLFRVREPLMVDEYLQRRQKDLISSFETVCNVMPNMVWRTDSEGQCDYCSDRWYDYTGLSVEETLGWGFGAAIHPDDLTSMMETWRRCVSTKLEFTYEVRCRRSDGCYKWMLVRAVPLKHSVTGDVLAWYGTHTDIHDHVMARKRNERKWNQVLSILSRAEIHLVAIDMEGEITMAEGAIGRGLGDERLSRDHIVGVNILKEQHVGTSEKLQEKIRDILAGKETMCVEEYVVGARTFKGRFVPDLTQVEASDSHELTLRGALGLSIDITDEKMRAALEIENARLQLEEQAAQNSNRMKSQFLANMSHEMRTPLAGVIGLVDLLMDTPLNQEQQDYINNIKLSSSMLLAIVNDVLDFSKVESGRLDIEEVQFNLCRSIKELRQLLLPSATRKGLDLIYEDTIDAALEVIGDPGRIRQILLNLLTNSIKFTEQGGTITLSATMKQKSDAVQVTFMVQDTGIGIEEDVLAQLFQPFRQGDASTARLYGGTGLGLAISRNLADLMNGHLQLDSRPGHGSKATFVVPLTLATASSPSSNAAGPVGWNLGRRPSRPLIDILTAQMTSRGAQPVSDNVHDVPESVPREKMTPLAEDLKSGTLDALERSQVQILVVEDNAINQTIALKTIKKLGFSAMAVWNGSEALDYLKSCLPPTVGDATSNPSAGGRSVKTVPESLPSIILMDVQMPVLDGYSATKAIRSESPWKDSEDLQKVPIIALTASAIQGDLEKCLSSGMNDYLAKPVSSRVLEQMLVKWGVKKLTEDDNMAAATM